MCALFRKVPACGWYFDCPTSINDTSFDLYAKRVECDQAHTEYCTPIRAASKWLNAACNAERVGSKLRDLSCNPRNPYSVKLVYSYAMVEGVSQAVSELLKVSVPVL